MTTRILSVAVVSASVILFYFFNPLPFGLRSGDGWIHRLVFPLQHGSLLHAVANLWCLAFYVLSPYRFGMTRYVLSYASSVCIPSFLIGSVPVVGMSGCIFFLSGSLLFAVQNKLKFFACSIAFIALGIPFEFCAVSMHAWCWTCGIAYAVLTTPIINVRHDGCTA